jgi:hypothetical protein
MVAEFSATEANHGRIAKFLKQGLTGNAFHFNQWSPHRRIALVLSAGQICLVIGAFVRIRMSYFIQATYPDYLDNQWAPMAKSLVELSHFMLALGVGLTVISLHRWLQGSSSHEAPGELPHTAARARVIE